MLYFKVNETRWERKGLSKISYLGLKSIKSGYVKCFAQNSIGEDEVTKTLYVTDVRHGLDIFGFDSHVNVDQKNDELEVALGETTKMTCGASIYNYTAQLEWLRDDEPIKNSESMETFTKTALLLTYICRISN